MTGPPPPPFHTPLSSAGGSGVNTNSDNTNNPVNDSPNLQELILGQMASLTELIRKHNAMGENVLRPIRLDFGDEGNEVRRERVVEVNEDLSKPFKEASRSPFTSRIVEFAREKYIMPLNMKFYDGSTDPNDHLTRFTGAANQGQWPMPTWCLMFQQTLDGAAGGWFERLEPGSINSWNELREQFSPDLHSGGNVQKIQRKSPRLSEEPTSRWRTLRKDGLTKPATSAVCQKSCAFRPS